MATPFKVKSLFEYSSPHDDDLNFVQNQIITVTAEEDDDWYIGEYPDDHGTLQSGLFPKNFVERYEPEIPSRPNRQSRQKTIPQSPTSPLDHDHDHDHDQTAAEPSALSLADSSIVDQPYQKSEHDPEPTPKHAQDQDQDPVSEQSKETPLPSSPPANRAKGPPPPVSEKPSSFKDRIAAFNKQSTPVKPFDPKAVSNITAKKPFVPPPPSRDAYVPVPKPELVSLIYKREEDPEIIERHKQEQRAAEDAGLAPTTDQAHGNQDTPKPQSLKDRIALLQAQQREQAERRAELAHKEKPPKPAKKGSQSSERPISSGYTDDQLDRVRTSEQSERSTHALPSRVATGLASPSIPSTSLDLDRDANNDGNEADQSTVEDVTELHDETSTQSEGGKPKNIRASGAPLQQSDAGDEEDTTEGEIEETEQDAELRRKMELRDRMAKMSGGMGMAGMFGPGMAIPAPGAHKPRPPKPRSSERPSIDEPRLLPAHAPMVPIPGMQPVPQSATVQPTTPVAEKDQDAALSSIRQRESDVEQAVMKDSPRRQSSDRRSMSRERPAIPAAIAQRSVPPLPPSHERPAAPSSPAAVSRISFDSAQPPQPPARDTALPTRSVPPPVPGLPPMPAPPTSSAPVEEPDEGQSEYEGDYDTDIGSSDKHKLALKSHMREPSIADSLTADEASVRSITPAASPPVHHRAPPPLPPSAFPPTRQRDSLDTPRAAPPPIPVDVASHAPSANERGISPPLAVNREVPPPPPTGMPAQRSVQTAQDDHPDESSDDLYRGTESRKSADRRLQDRAPPPPPPPTAQVAAPRTSESGGQGVSRRSLDAKGLARRSIDAGRGGQDGFIAGDVDLGQDSQWWAQENTPPPAFQDRGDVLYEIEQSAASKRGGKTTISKDVYILFQDYSQTVVTARYDSREVGDVHLEQRHEAPPARLRQDQLESYWQKYGAQVMESANHHLGGKKDGTVGDGSPNALVLELFRPLKNALRPVGTRAYGALIYANMANASVQQFDEIRPGDIITLRNAKMQGKSGGLHQKYSMEVGMTATQGAGAQGHVAIVVEWDGTKKKIRALEQGREKSKPRVESFRLGDLKSGEVKVWRIVGREWVGWDSDGTA